MPRGLALLLAHQPYWSTIMQHILLPTDFSKNAWNAIAYVLALLKTKKCTFYLLHVIPYTAYSGVDNSYNSNTTDLKNTLLEESRAQMKQLTAKIEGMPPAKNQTIIALTECGHFVEVLKKVVEAHKIDLIGMGTKGATGLKKITVGSNTADVITKIQIPLLAIPENANFAPPKEIVFPTDFHTGYEVTVLNTLLYFTALYKAQVRVLHISKKGESLTAEQLKNKEFLSDYLRHTDHSFHSLTGTDLEKAVQCFTESRDMDMIAMVAKNLNFFQRILFRPNVAEISYHTQFPFLVLHEGPL